MLSDLVYVNATTMNGYHILLHVMQFMLAHVLPSDVYHINCVIVFKKVPSSKIILIKHSRNSAVLYRKSMKFGISEE